MASIEISKDSLPALTGLRFIAALCILIFHFSYWALPFNNVPLSYQKAVDLSSLGMTLFFVLSGVVIHLNYSHLFSTKTWCYGFADLLVARFARLYPLYLFFIVFAVVRQQRLHELFLTDPAFQNGLFIHLLGLQSWWPFSVSGTLQMDWEFHVSWSISTEIFFYLAYPFFGISIFKIKDPSKAFLAVLIWIFVSFLILYSLFTTQSIWLPLGNQLVADNTGNGFYKWLTYISPYIRIMEFVLGCFFAQLYLVLKEQPLSPFEKIYGRRISMFFALAILSLTILKSPLTRQFAFINFTYSNFFLAPFVGGLIFCVCRYTSPIKKLLELNLLILLGEISYSLYLMHPWIPRLIDIPKLEFIKSTLWLGPLYLFMAFVLVVLFSFGTYSLIEKPCRQFLRVKLGAIFPANKASHKEN